MTDVEMFTAMLVRAKVQHEAQTVAFSNTKMITIGTDGPANQGYSGFMTNFIFSSEGDLVLVAVWE